MNSRKTKIKNIIRTAFFIISISTLLVACAPEEGGINRCDAGRQEEFSFDPTGTTAFNKENECAWHPLGGKIKNISPTESLCCVNKAALETSGIIYDFRCQRERILKPEDNGYVDSCCIEGNTERQIECLEKEYPSDEKDTGLFGDGGFSVFKADIVINKDTLPALIRLIISLPLAAIGLINIFMAVKITEEWFRAVWGNYKDDLVKLRTQFLNAWLGTAVSAGALLLVWLFFYVAGYRGDIFDFTQDTNRLLDIDCISIERKDVCEKYEFSCVYDSTEGCKTNPDEVDIEAKCFSYPKPKTVSSSSCPEDDIF